MDESHSKKKTLLEEYALKYFIEDYERQTGIKSIIISRQEGPDAVDEINGDRLGLEITHLYYDKDEARMLFGRSEK